MAKIGDTVYLFDQNTRRYTAPSPEEKKAGRIWGSLIWRGHWVPVKIVGETRVSWLLEHGAKIPKKTARINNESPAMSEDELNDRCLVDEHGYKISEIVRRADASQLRSIANIIGYKL